MVAWWLGGRSSTLTAMPRTCRVSPTFDALLVAQDFVVTRAQCYANGLTRHALTNRATYDGWQELVTNVFLSHPGEPSRRQLMIGALLFAGSRAAIDDVDACRFYGLKAVSVEDDRVYVVTPEEGKARSTGYVVVRRTSAPMTVTRTDRLRYIHPADAVIAAARRRKSDRAVLALLSDAVQRNVTSYAELTRAHIQGSPRSARRTDDMLAHVGAGVRSAPEGDFRRLAEASTVLPPLLYNRRLRLPSGRIIRPDALAPNAGLAHETNGRSAHNRDDLFEDMQERHDAMTEAGLTVLHNTPRRIWLRGREVIAQFERVYAREAGRGMPVDVELLPDDGAVR
jgi:hypothetical protein